MKNTNCLINIMTITQNRVHICYCTKWDTDLNKSIDFFLNPICIYNAYHFLILYYLLMYLYCTNKIHLTDVLTDHLSILTHIKAWLLPINKIKPTTSVLYYDLENSLWKIFAKL